MMTRKLRPLALAVFATAGVSAFLAASPAGAETLPAIPSFYVDGSSIGGPCSDARSPTQNSRTAPWCTIGRAVQAAPATGGNVLVRAGSYKRQAVSAVARDSYVSLAPYGAELPVIAGLTLTGVSHLRVENLNFTSTVIARASSDLQFSRNRFVLKPAGLSTRSAMYLESVDNMVIDHNWVYNGRDGVVLNAAAAPSTDVVIWANRFERLGGDGVHVGVGTRGVTLFDNDFIDVRARSDVDPSVHSDAMQVLGPTQGVRAFNNEVRGGRGFLFMIHDSASSRAGSANQGVVIMSNVFSGYDFGLRLFSAPGARIINNTVWGMSTGAGTGLDILDRTGVAAHNTGLVLVNNIAKRLDIAGAVGLSRSDHNLVGGDPKLTSDLRPSPASSAVDAADPAEAPSVDARAEPRDGLPDIGALEYRP